jgi:hypothetical protein
MAFKPDILVTEAGSCLVLLIVETKPILDLRESDSQLKRYMWEISSPVGLLVFPRHLHIYRNRFTGYSDDSVQLIGTFPAPKAWQVFEERKSGFEFEIAVQRWLEEIQTNPALAQVPRETREALAEYILPSLISGEIQAAGPRVTG